MPPIQNVFKIGAKALVAQDADLRGEISVGSSTVLHPKCTIIALSGPIEIGPDCIVEELVVIVNRRKTPLRIGPSNHFQVGCRVESPSVGSGNVFEPRCRVSCDVSVGDGCVVGSGCSLVPLHSPADFRFSPDDEDEEMQVDGQGPSGAPREEVETLPDRTIVFGSSSQRRTWSGEGQGQAAALHAKHLAFLHDMLPKYTRLKQLASDGAPPPTPTPPPKD